MARTREIAPGIRRWVAWHPEWERDVGCLLLSTGSDLVLIDPLVPGDGAEGWSWIGAEIEAAARAAIVLTVFFHDRSAGAIHERWPDVEVWGEAGGVDRIPGVVTVPFRAGDELPGSLEARAVPRPGEVVLWAPAAGAVIAGDVLLGKAGGVTVCPAGWLPDETGRADVAAALEPLLDLPIERVIVSHGEPILEGGREALEAAIAEARTG